MTETHTTDKENIQQNKSLKSEEDPNAVGFEPR